MNNDVSPSGNSTTIITTSNEPIELPDSELLPVDNDVQIINSQDKCITLDDDNDSDVIIEENNPVIIDTDSDDLEIIESNNTPIVIEDEDRNCVINPLNYIKQKQDQLFDTVCQENSLLAQVIEDAINLDPSGSMKRIIQRTLIPLYLTCNIKYKESEAFKNTLKRTSILLETAPHLKYSHIKSVCEILKLVKINRPRRVRQQASVSTPKKRKLKHKKTRQHKKRRKDPTNANQRKEKKQKDNTESTTSKAKTINDTWIEIDIPNITTISPTSNKENMVNENIQTRIDIHNNSNNTASTDAAHNNLDNNTETNANNLLTPHYAVTTQVTPPKPHQKTVESLEKQIAFLKSNLERTEEQEVTDDTMSSSYLVAESLKSKIVTLYKQLCDLMGMESTKRHEVKLQVVNGHPPGPARCLEEYINDNIDEYGNPPFPNIFEVVCCVEKAVEEDNLNRIVWNRKRIVAEAQVLLKHYGHAIQKRRKKREWRDMVSRCKEELVDPADLDPTLEAKLLANSRIAKRNEDEIVDKYARIEKENSSNPAFRLSFETAEDDSESDNEDIHNNMAVDNNIQEAPSLTMTNSTTNVENIQTPLTSLQGNLSIIESNIHGASNAINSRNILQISPRGSSRVVSSINVMKNNIQNDSNVINTTHIVDSNLRNVSSLINPDLTTNLQNCQILIVNSQNNSLPDLHGSICFINSTPVLATRIEGCPSFIKSTNAEGNLQNAANNSAGNLQNGPNFINNSTGNLQNGPNFINNSAGNLQNGPNFINNSTGNLQNNSSNNLDGNPQSRLSNINTFNDLEGNLQNEPGFTNSSNNIAGKLQSGNNFTNSNTLAANQESGNTFINTSNNLQNRPNTVTSNNLEGNLQNGPNNKESILQISPTDTKTEKQSTLTNVDNIDYNRTIMIDSTGSDTDNERKEHTDIVTHANTDKERDKSEDEIEYKIKVKQEEDDIMKLLSELGSDCVATVFDIEDPFLVIEISDSSDEEV